MEGQKVTAKKNRHDTTYLNEVKLQWPSSKTLAIRIQAMAVVWPGFEHWEGLEHQYTPT